MDYPTDDTSDDEDNVWLNEAMDNYEAYEAMLAAGDFAPEPQRGGIVHDPFAGKVTVKPNGSRRSPKYGYKFDRYDVTVKDLEYVQLSEVPYFIHRLLAKLIKDVTAKALPHHKVRICIESPSLAYPIWTPPIDKNQLSATRWMAEVSRGVIVY